MSGQPVRQGRGREQASRGRLTRGDARRHVQGRVTVAAADGRSHRIRPGGRSGRGRVRSLKQAGVAMGVADSAAFDQIDADLERNASPGFARIPDMVSVIKRKPG